MSPIQVTHFPTSPREGQPVVPGIFCYDFFNEKAYFEIAYRIHEENGQFIVVVLSGTRENFYAEVKQYMR